MVRRSLVAVIALSLSCVSTGKRRPGVSLPQSQLHQHRADLPALVADLLARGKRRDAFYVLEAHKTRRFAAQRLAARHPAIGAALLAEQRDLRELFAAIVEPAAPGTASRSIRMSASRAPELRRGATAGEIDALYWEHLQVIDARFDAKLPYGHAIRWSFAPTTATEATLLFDDRELFLSYFAHGDRMVVFSVHGGRLQVTPLTATAQQIARTAAALQAQVSRPPATGDNPRSWQAPAAALFDQLLGPIKAKLGGISAMYVSSDGPLRNVPFNLLVADGRPLIERFRTTYLQSASVYRNLILRPAQTAPPRLLAIGDAVYPAGAPPLPAAAREADAVSFVYDQRRLLLGAEARESRVRELVGSHNILHFATHGVMMGDKLPGASSLLLTADGEADGFLSAAEIAGLDLSHAYLAVLSACETSFASGDGGDLSSITSAFATAGVPSVVGSLWKVSDDSTTRLMLDFYSKFLSAGAGEAMRQAQLALRKRPAYRHPYYWAAFALYGADK